MRDSIHCCFIISQVQPKWVENNDVFTYKQQWILSLTFSSSHTTSHASPTQTTKPYFFLFPHSLCLSLSINAILFFSKIPKLFVFYFLFEPHSHNCLYHCYVEAIIETVASWYPRQSLANTASRVSFFPSLSFAF